MGKGEEEMNKDRELVKALGMCPGCIQSEKICVTIMKPFDVWLNRLEQVSTIMAWLSLAAAIWIIILPALRSLMTTVAQ